MEKYGTMPKRFTKEWWGHYWYYYKTRVIIILIFVGFAAVTITQCATKVRYDMTITYAGSHIYYDKNLARFEEAVGGVIDDKNGNGKIDVHIMQINIADEGSSTVGTEYDSAMISKEAVELQAGETYMFLFSVQEFERILSQPSAEYVFVPSEEIFDSMPEQDSIAEKDGTAYAVNVSGYKFLDDNGFYSDNVYLAVRRIRSGDEEKQEEQIAYSNAVKLANHIVNSGKN